MGEADFGRLGLLQELGSCRPRVVQGFILTLGYSRLSCVIPVFKQDRWLPSATHFRRQLTRSRSFRPRFRYYSAVRSLSTMNPAFSKRVGEGFTTNRPVVSHSLRQRLASTNPREA
jgi:hypothetical protein